MIAVGLSAAKLEVGKDKKYANIQAAWNAADNGDEIIVYEGKYAPRSSGRTLIAKGNRSSIYIHPAKGERVVCNGSFYFYDGNFKDIVIEGFEFINAQRGIWLDARGSASFNNVIIRDNIIAECKNEGLYFYNRSVENKFTNILIENNTIYKCAYGIRWFVRPDGIRNNNILRDNLAVSNKIGFYRYGKLLLENCAAWDNKNDKGKNTNWISGKGKNCVESKTEFISTDQADSQYLFLAASSNELVLKKSTKNSFIGAAGPKGRAVRNLKWDKDVPKAKIGGRVLKKVLGNISISGRVFVDKNKNGKFDNGEKGIAGVLVSNGEKIIKSAGDGRYKFENFPADESLCVFAISPDGYLSTNNFYYRAIQNHKAADFGFTLDPKGKIHDFSFIHGADIQYNIAEHKAKWLEQAKKLNKIAQEDKIDFFLCVGDLTPLGKKVNLELIKTESDKFDVPFYAVFGGHDGIETGRTLLNYAETFGPPYYSWNYGGVHFIALVSETMFMTKKQLAKQWTWLENDLKLIPQDKPVFICTHVPGYISPELEKLQKKYNLAGIFFGHWHTHHHFLASKVPAFCSSPWRELDWGVETNRLRTINWKNGKLTSSVKSFWETPKLTPLTKGKLDFAIKDNWTSYLGPNGNRDSKVKIKLPLKLIWSTDTSAIQPYFSSPVISNGKILFGVTDGQAGSKKSGLLCLNAKDGKKLWKKYIPSDVFSTPVVDNKTVYVMNGIGACYALNTEKGNTVWELAAPESIKNERNSYRSTFGWKFAPAPLSLQNDKLFAVSNQGMRCVSTKDGKLLWHQQTPLERNYPVAGLAPCGSLVFGEDQNQVFALNSSDGQIKWVKKRKQLKFNQKRERAIATPVISDGYVYFPGRCALRKLDLSGKELWASRISDSLNYLSSPAVSGKTVVIASGNYIQAFNTDSGESIWKFACRTASKAGLNKYQIVRNGSAPAIADNKVFCGSDDGYLYILDLKTGRKLQEVKLGGPVKSSVALSNNFVCISDFYGRIYAFSGQN